MMFGIFGGKHKELNADIDNALSHARDELNKNTPEGRKVAFNLLIPVLEKAREKGFEGRDLEMFTLLGDIYTQSEDWAQALNAYGDGISANNGKGIGNEHLHFRLGKCYFELGEQDRAADELCRAYMGGGKQIFDNENPRYFEFLKTKIQPGPGGW